MKIQYVCNRFPFLSIQHLKFERGSLIVEKESDKALIEANEWYDVYIVFGADLEAPAGDEELEDEELEEDEGEPAAEGAELDPDTRAPVKRKKRIQKKR